MQTLAQNNYTSLFSLVVLKKREREKEKKKKRGKEIHISKGLDLGAAGKAVVKFMKGFFCLFLFIYFFKSG